MVFLCRNTAVIYAHGMVAPYQKARMVELLEGALNLSKLSAIQFCPRGRIRLTFCDPDERDLFVRKGVILLDNRKLMVSPSDQPNTVVYIHYYLVEGDSDTLLRELNYGPVVNIKDQTYAEYPTGSKIETMSLSWAIPAETNVDVYRCRVWYRGIKPFCFICSEEGHKAANCHFDGKCRCCGEAGHRDSDCRNPWGHRTDAVHDPAVGSGEGAGVVDVAEVMESEVVSSPLLFDSPEEAPGPSPADFYRKLRCMLG